MDQVWIETLADIDYNGTSLNSRNGMSKEILGFSKRFSCHNSFLFNKLRRLSPWYACAEFLWYLSMTSDTSFLQLFAPQYSRFCEDGINAYGAYGHRWINNMGFVNGQPLTNSYSQLDLAIEVLKEHPESRQVIVAMWDSKDLHHAKLLNKKDLPCTLTHQFLLRDGVLHLVTTMRSNDVWLGMPYDVFCNCHLLKLVANEIDAESGTYTHNVGSMHLYEKNYEKVDELLEHPLSKLLVSGCVDLEDTYMGYNPCGLSIIGRALKATAMIKTVSDLGHDAGHDIRHVITELGRGTIIADFAAVCCCKWLPEAIEYVVSPMLRKAVEVFNER